VFLPGVTSRETRGRLYAISGQALCITGGTVPIGPTTDGAWLYLGALDGEPCFAREVGGPLPGTELVPLRQLFGVLSDEELGVASRALGLTTWDRDHRHCGRCGGPTEPSPVERVRTCVRCSHGAYPRLSPAVIVLIEKDGHALLARNARTSSPFHSTLAGFVEVGETLEETVVREVREEAGIELRDIRYFGSQPWPLTGSLMIGFTAQWAAGELVPDRTEIFEADWFPHDALPRVSGRMSIARALIDDFVRRHGGTPAP
jgi:NAD+ diphosphatase